MSDFFESVGSFFSGRVQRQLPSIIVEFIGPDAVIDANDPSEEALMRWCWARVHSPPRRSGTRNYQARRINGQHQQPVAKEEKVISTGCWVVPYW
ncbi:hypothetical protein L2E82_12474 [Cichorium intybus]|uniref:Uncharacterized protein n=1 Tax=Cichorium intybus TaxID=13427 RepID=A0ACB9GI54_CICIN|nr:hypothetical protein L2E82_12474 [Cichorium intybus]